MTDNDNGKNFFEVLGERVSNLEEINQQTTTELSNILNSKKWIYATKIATFINKTFHRPPNDKQLIVASVNNIDEVINTEKSALPAEPKASNSNRIDIINLKFYDLDGNIFMNGGAERYVFDLATMLKKHGKKVRILQIAKKDFTKKYRGIEVVGVKVAHTEWWRFKEASRALNKECQGSELVIASPLELASEIENIPCVGINHGLALDDPFDYSTRGNIFLINRYRIIFQSLKRVEQCVCVDTNFMNWVQTFDYDERRKLQYIPNYFDKNIFQPTPKSISSKIIFTFPRRLAEYRGLDITITAFDRILEKYADKVELRLVGQFHSKENRLAVERLMRRYPDNVIHREVAMDDMPYIYRDSHVVLIPTKWSEGTSLSCIEAMATRNAIIATNVGGLPNLIVNGYNGLLINPTADDLEAACISLINTPKMISDLADNALAVSRVFNKDEWEKSWLELLGSYIAR